MDLLLCWLIGPAASLLVALGLSFGVELTSGARVPWCVRPALGLAVMILIAQLGVSTDATAELAIPAAVGLGVFGLVMGWSAGLTKGPFPGWEIAAALGVYCVFAAPVVLSGEPTWAGYIKLDDTGSWMGFADHAFEFGRRTNGFAPSTWEALIQINISTGYPMGAFVPMALIGKLTGQDVAWTVQPSMALMAAMLTLLLAELVRPLIRPAPARAAVAFLAGQSATLLGYALWGGVKEITAATLLALAPLLAWQAIRRQPEARWPWILPGLVAAAFVAVLGPGGAVWLLPTMLPLLLEARRRIGGAAALALAWKALAVAVVATLPQLITPNGLFDPFQSFLFKESELGNLSGPLSLLHLMGIWPAVDFRLDPKYELGVTIVIAVLAGLAFFAAYTAIRQRELTLPSYFLGGALAFAVVYAVGSPWVDGKGMAILSPAVLVAGLTGVAILIERTRFNIEGWLVGSFAAALILWSSFLAYQGVWLAPRAEHRELEQIGERFAGRGPALVTEGSTYGPRHFLRRLDAENAKDLRRRPVNLVDGSLPDGVPYLDTDAIATDALAPYRLLVFRRSPVASRPPGDFRLAYAGKYYEVWARTAPIVAGKSLAEHLPLGEPLESSAVPNCAEVKALADRAGPGATLVAARPGDYAVVDLGNASVPASWASGDPGKFTPRDSGTLEAEAPVATAGDYRVWIGGDIYGEVEVSAGGQTAPGVRQALNINRYQPFGPFSLGAGDQRITIAYQGPGLAPGSGADPTPVGPILLERVQPDDRGTVTVSASQYRRLCGESWDWIESYA